MTDSRPSSEASLSRMRRRRVLRLVAVALGVFATIMGSLKVAKMTHRPQFPLIVKSLDEFGVVLVSPQAPEFDARVRAFVDAPVGALFEFKPCLVIVSNRSHTDIVAYSVSFASRQKDGSYDRRLMQFKFPDAVAGSEETGNPFGDLHGLAPGDIGVVGLGYGVEPHNSLEFLKAFRDETTAYVNSSTEVTISLDAVIFRDGKLIGPNRSQLDEHFVRYLTAKQHVYRSVVDALVKGASVDDAFASIVTTRTISLSSARPTVLALYAGKAASEAAQWRSRVGDGDIHRVFSRAVRRDDFVVHPLK